MGKVHGCPCGAVQSDVAFPTHNKIHLITDEDLDSATRWSDETMTRDAFDAARKEGYFCYDCGRLLLLDGDRLRVFEERDRLPPSEERTLQDVTNKPLAPSANDNGDASSLRHFVVSCAAKKCRSPNVCTIAQPDCTPCQARRELKRRGWL